MAQDKDAKSNRRLALLLALMSACFGGCTTTITRCPGFAKLERITLESKVDPSSAIAVERDGKKLAAAEEMELEKGDVVSTGPNATAVVTFAGARAVLKPNTRVKLGSLFAWFGEIFVSGWLTTKTKYAAAAVEGTKYHVKVDPETSRTTFTVLEGRVRVKPTEASWPEIMLRSGERVGVGVNDREAAPATTKIPAEELEQLTEEAYAMGRSRGPVVPDLQGAELAAAQAQLATLGLSVSRIEQMPLAETPGAPNPLVGHVILQQPQPGAYSKEVELTVGVRGVAVPTLIGSTQAQAEQQLQAAGLVLHPGASATGSAGTVVVSQDPPAGFRVAVGAKVEVAMGTAASGAHGDTAARPEVVLPDVTAVTPKQARASLRAAGLNVELRETPRADARHARVISQNPPPGTTLRAGDRVELVAALPGVTVPDVRASTMESATQKLKQLGLAAKLAGEASAADPKAQVVSQQPAAGSTVQPGETVEVTVQP